MTTWNKELSISIDADAPEGASCLLEGKASTARQTTLYFLQGDKFTQKIFFRRKADSNLNASTPIELEAGLKIVLAGKVATSLDATTLLFSATDFTLSGAGDDACYTALLDLNTQEISQLFDTLAATSVAIKVDVEIQNADNTERSTYQFDAILKQQVYAGESNPQPGTPVYPLPGNLVLKQADGSWVRFQGAEQNIYLYHAPTNKFYPLVISVIDGVASVGAGEGVAP